MTQPLDYRQPEKPKPRGGVEWLFICIVCAMALYVLLLVTVLVLDDSPF